MNPVIMIPLDVRRKLQVLLLVRHSSLGRELSCLHDDYYVYFKERIDPRMYGCKDWESFLKAIPEVEVKRTKRCKVVYGNPLTHDFAEELLSRVFSSGNLSEPETDVDMIQEMPDASVDAFVNSLLEGNAEVENVPPGPNQQEVERREDNVTSSCQDFPVNFEKIPKVEVEAPDSPFQRVQPVVAAADSGSQPDEGETEEYFDFNEIVNQKIRFLESDNGSSDELEPGVVAPSSNAILKIPESNDRDSATEAQETGGVLQEFTSDSEEKKVFLQKSTNEDDDDDIEVVFESFKTTSEGPVVKTESNQSSPYDAIIPPKCTFRAHQDGPASKKMNTHTPSNGTISKLKTFNADFVCNRRTIYINALASSGPNQLRTPSPVSVSEEVRVKCETEGAVGIQIPIKVTVCSTSEKKMQKEVCRNFAANAAFEFAASSTQNARETRPADDSIADHGDKSGESIPSDFLQEQDQGEADVISSPIDSEVAPLPYLSTEASVTNCTSKDALCSVDHDADLEDACVGTIEDTSSSTTDSNDALRYFGTNLSFSDCELHGPSHSSESFTKKISRSEDAANPLKRKKRSIITPADDTPSNVSSSANERKSPRPKRVKPIVKTQPPTSTKPPFKKAKLDSPKPSSSVSPNQNRGTRENFKYIDLEWYKASTLQTNYINHLYIHEEAVNSEEPFIDRNACNTYLEVNRGSLDIDVDSLRTIRNNKNDRMVCFHRFWSLTSQCKETAFAGLWKDNQIIPKISFEAVQLLNIDADIGHSLSSEYTDGQLNFISSYGNFQDFFILRNANKCRGIGLMPTLLNLDKSSRSSGIFYNNFFPFTAGDSEVDILDPTIRRKFEEFVQSNIPSLEVDVFVANGMGSPLLDQRPQDICLAQCYLALKLLKEGGHFVIKLEDTLTYLGVTLIYLMSRCFRETAVYKPISALPGERFVICKNRRPNGEVKSVRDFLYQCYQSIVQLSWENQTKKVSRLFESESPECFKQFDPKFLEYIQLQNSRIANIEWTEWCGFMESSKLASCKTIKENLLKELGEERDRNWKSWIAYTPLDVIVHNMNLKYDSSKSKPEAYWQRLFGINDGGLLDRSEKSVTNVLKRYNMPVGHMNQWMFLPSSGYNNRFIILACEDAVYKYQDRTWKIVQDLQLTKGTVLYGEFLQRCSTSRVLNIIDAAFIGDEDIRNKSLIERRAVCLKFALDMDTPVNLEYRVICAEIMEMKKLTSFLAEIAIEKYKIHNSDNQLMDTVCSNDSGNPRTNLVEFKPSEVLLLKIRTVPEDKSTDGSSEYVDDSSNFGFLMKNRLFWEWNPRLDLNRMAVDAGSEFDEAFATALFECLAENAKN